MKHSPDGTRTWVATETTIGGGIGRAMTLDADDNVIVVGSANGGDRFGVVKYDPDGNLLWSRRYNGSGFLTQLEGVGTDSSGAIYAYGNHWPSTNDPQSIIVVKWDASGTRQWVLVYATPSSRGSAIEVTDDAVYIVGDSEVLRDDQDLLVMKIQPTGTIEWVRTSGRSGQFVHDTAWDVSLDSAGNIVAAGSYSGFFADPNTSTDIAVVRNAPDGTLLAETTYDGPFGAPTALDQLGLFLIQLRLDFRRPAPVRTPVSLPVPLSLVTDRRGSVSRWQRTWIPPAATRSLWPPALMATRAPGVFSYTATPGWCTPSPIAPASPEQTSKKRSRRCFSA